MVSWDWDDGCAYALVQGRCVFAGATTRPFSTWPQMRMPALVSVAREAALVKSQREAGIRPAR